MTAGTKEGEPPNLLTQVTAYLQDVEKQLVSAPLLSTFIIAVGIEDALRFCDVETDIDPQRVALGIEEAIRRLQSAGERTQPVYPSVRSLIMLCRRRRTHPRCHTLQCDEMSRGLQQRRNPRGHPIPKSVLRIGAFQQGTQAGTNQPRYHILGLLLHHRSRDGISRRSRVHWLVQAYGQRRNVGERFGRER